jgi:hypothetical protein
VGAAAILGTLISAGGAAGQVPPDEKYVMFDTEHFRVIFPPHLERFAQRAAGSAEWSYATLSRYFIEPPKGRISLVIADNNDRPNASATAIPENRITLIATPDIASRGLNFYTDWVDLTVAHELVHIFHLDDARGIWSPFRTVFGRNPIFFPAFYQPRWVIEGLATYYESRLTGSGRAYGTYFNMLLSSAADEGGFLAVDAADGLVPNWPAGQAPYSYGGYYFRAEAEAHGDSAIAEFTRRGAGRLPYTLDWAATPAFGQKLTTGWDLWSEDFEASARARADSLRSFGLTVGEPLSGYSWIIPSPRYSPDGRYLAFTFVPPTEDPATVVLDAESGRQVRRERRNSAGGNAWSRDGPLLYALELELKDRYRTYGDLYTLDVASGTRRRLTVNERLANPDMSPDGGSLVAVQTGEGSNRLVLIDVATLEVRALTDYQQDVNWERPRFSPGGTRIAVERWAEDGIIDVVVLDLDGRVVWQVTDDAAVDMAPAWSPDGRYLLWSSDRGAGLFDIYAVETGGGARSDAPAADVRRVTRTLGGALDPDVSADGRRLAYVAQYPEGFRVEWADLDPGRWERVGASVRSLRPQPLPRSSVPDSIVAPVRSYSPFPSLWPKAWLPILQINSDPDVGTFLGATLFGADDLRRHSYAILAGWRTGVARPEGFIGYIFSGLGDPVLQLSVKQDWGLVQARTTDGTLVKLLEREREVRLSANFAHPQVQSFFTVIPSLAIDRMTVKKL